LLIIRKSSIIFPEKICIVWHSLLNQQASWKTIFK
jgi:hypothetical protein